MRTNTENVLTDELDIEQGFNDAIDSLRKSLSLSSAELRKSKDDDEEPEDDDESEDDDDGDEESYQKSIEYTLREEPEAAAAMDVEPFLLQLAKAIDESIGEIGYRVSRVEKMTKSIGMAAVASANLQKSTREIVQRIGGTPVPSGSMRRLEKSRFEGSNTEVDTRAVLEKSRDWFRDRKITLEEAGLIEGRINKGLLGQVNDRIDQKVSELMGGSN